ncbi:unnamed protein product [Urochloa decumbens]|uniref:F-box protein AT5G49610-like beta-propeller domain-containing protein n=1 Tax=Urochloa decumbens TaxID=240449 RepID=A0ABC9FN46_9POAL
MAARRRLISDTGFCRRFDEFHPRPKMLGFLCNINIAYREPVAHFVPTTSSSCSPLAAYDHHGWRAEDARHGRVLLSLDTTEHILFMVWDPITGHRQELPARPWTHDQYRWRGAAIHCATTGTCNHLNCSRGPFHVVYISSRTVGEFTCTYSSESAAWSKPVSAYLDTNYGSGTSAQSSVLVGKALYFKIDGGTLVKKYDCELCKVVSTIPLPLWSIDRSSMLITMEDGGLGCVALLMYSLYLWSRKGDYKVDNGWLQSSVIDLQRTLRIDTLPTTPWMDVVGFADGIGTIFLRMNYVLFTIDLKTNKVEEVYNGSICSVVPYMGFCTPGASLLLDSISNIYSE